MFGGGGLSFAFRVFCRVVKCWQLLPDLPVLTTCCWANALRSWSSELLGGGQQKCWVLLYAPESLSAHSQHLRRPDLGAAGGSSLHLKMTDSGAVRRHCVRWSGCRCPAPYWPVTPSVGVRWST